LHRLFYDTLRNVSTYRSPANTTYQHGVSAILAVSMQPKYPTNNLLFILVNRVVEHRLVVRFFNSTDSALSPNGNHAIAGGRIYSAPQRCLSLCATINIQVHSYSYTAANCTTHVYIFYEFLPRLPFFFLNSNVV